MIASIRPQASPAASFAAVCVADAPMAGHAIPDLPPGDTARDAQLSIHDHGAVAVVSVRGDLDYLGASMLQACLSDIRWQGRARSVADLTGLAFIDCACLSVLARHCKMVRGHNGSFALAAPQPAVRRILDITGLLTWFEVHHTVEEAVASALAPPWPEIRAARPAGGSWR